MIKMEKLALIYICSVWRLDQNVIGKGERRGNGMEGSKIKGQVRFLCFHHIHFLAVSLVRFISKLGSAICILL